MPIRRNARCVSPPSRQRIKRPGWDERSIASAGKMALVIRLQESHIITRLPTVILRCSNGMVSCFSAAGRLDSTARKQTWTKKRVDYVLGSGNHSRTYLHLTDKNILQQLPLAWYSEKSGYWAMNPGYDRPDYAGSVRPIFYDCMFCHNGYPQIPNGQNRDVSSKGLPSNPCPKVLIASDAMVPVRIMWTKRRPAPRSKQSAPRS